MTEATVDVLVIDDDDVMPETVYRALRHRVGRYRVVSAMDGVDGLAVLRGQADRNVQRPYLVLLDLNMPRMNGFEFLEEIRRDAALRDSVVFVLSTSDSDTDRSRAYHRQIAGYMVKSSLGPQFGQLSNLLDEFTSTVSLPG